jgi:hypothetical protein
VVIKEFPLQINFIHMLLLSAAPVLFLNARVYTYYARVIIINRKARLAAGLFGGADVVLSLAAPHPRRFNF